MKSVKTITEDLCETDEVITELSNFDISDADISCCFSGVEKVVPNFESDGNGEKFYPCFYSLLPKKHNEIFPSLSRDASMSVCLELADQILAFITVVFSGNDKRFQSHRLN